jgi:hypothetical protein
MKEKKALTLIELLVASVLLVAMAASTGIAYFSIRRLSNETTYRYAALNLGKEILEYAEAGSIAHGNAFKYYYPRATSNTLLSDSKLSSLPTSYSGICSGQQYLGYRLKEWRYFSTDCNGGGYDHPFKFLGDIKAKGLVPKRAPDSVVIFYYLLQDPAYDNAYRATVEISWQEEVGGPIKKETLSVIPIRAVNDQLKLNTAEFWWE